VTGWDIEGFRAAVEARDVAGWLAYYAPDAEWVEYRHADPPRAPHVMTGHAVIVRFLHGVAAAPLRLVVDHDVVGEARAAFRITVHLPGDRRIIEQVIVELADGLITRQVDVEAWDP
jgi:hypothetical protein